MAIKHDEKKPRARKKFSYQEIDVLKKELEPYKTEKVCDIDYVTAKKGDKINILRNEGLLKYLQDKGIIKIYDLKLGRFGVVEDKMINYEEFNNKMSMFLKVEGKKNHAVKMEAIEYEKIAQSMPDDDIPF